MSLTGLLGVVLGTAVVAVPIWLAVKLTDRRKTRGWMARLAQEQGFGYFADSGETLELGIDPESGKPLREVRFRQCLELRYRERQFVAVEYMLGAGTDSPRYHRPANSVQVAAPAEWTFQLTERARYRDVSARFAEGLEQVKTFDPAFDQRFLVRATDRALGAERLTPELRRRLVDEPRFSRWSIVAEAGYLYTRVEGGSLSRDDLFAQADFLLDVLTLFPPTFWPAP